MIPELGLICLVVALLAALLQASALVPAWRMALSPCLLPAAWLQALAATLALATLMVLRLNSDFSVVNVVAHSSLALPLLYKIAGTWGNHEGSMLLFVWVLAAFGVMLAMNPSQLLRDFRERALAVQAAVLAGVVLFVLFTSNPFERRFPPAVDGQTLNPILQDIALSIHPPLLYLGYVGFSIVFSLAVAALLQGRAGRDWAAATHPWILASWSALTLGIGLGSWWAYRELGWGGWWFWDPVENASLLPWLAGTALLHANIVLKKRGLLAQWVIVLAIVTFGLSLLGTFLVRSGALTSVHSFVSDPMRGLFILAFMGVTIGGALLLFALRAARLQSEGEMVPLSREGMIVINNLFILTACATVLTGTIYPLVAEWLADEKLSVGAPYFNLTFLPLMAIPLAFAGLAPLIAWKEASWRSVLKAARPSLIAAIAVLLLVLAFVHTKAATAALGFGLSAWLAASSFQWLLSVKKWQSSLQAGRLAVFLGHFGAAIMVAGITGAGVWKSETGMWISPGDTAEIAGYRLTYHDEVQVQKENYQAWRGRFDVVRGERIHASLMPEYRVYDIRRTVTSEAAIYSTVMGDLYAVIGEHAPDGKRTAARFYYIPMIRFIWAGFMLMALSGIVAILQQRRVSRGNA